MFQFPGFAFLSLYIQPKNTWFTKLLATPKGSNNIVSGGLPHSEIHGSKLILSSPWLIAEYHVFHRLLLPRHSPNALFALDLIQKKQDLRLARITEAGKKLSSLFQIKSILLPALTRADQDKRATCVALVSVLDLDNTFVSTGIPLRRRGSIFKPAFHRSGTNRDQHPTRCDQIVLLLYLSLRCQWMLTHPRRPIGRLNTQECLAI
jgi:hypothetical protein